MGFYGGLVDVCGIVEIVVRNLVFVMEKKGLIYINIVYSWYLIFEVVVFVGVDNYICGGGLGVSILEILVVILGEFFVEFYGVKIGVVFVCLLI